MQLWAIHSHLSHCNQYCINNQHYSQGDEGVNRFEQLLQTYVGIRHIDACSATSADKSLAFC